MEHMAGDQDDTGMGVAQFEQAIDAGTPVQIVTSRDEFLRLSMPILVVTPTLNVGAPSQAQPSLGATLVASSTGEVANTATP